MGYQEPEQHQLREQDVYEPPQHTLREEIVEETGSTHIGTDGITINTGHWGVDLAAIVAVIAITYIGKKMVDRHFDKKHKE